VATSPLTTARLAPEVQGGADTPTPAMGNPISTGNQGVAPAPQPAACAVMDVSPAGMGQMSGAMSAMSVAARPSVRQTEHPLPSAPRNADDHVAVALAQRLQPVDRAVRKLRLWRDLGESTISGVSSGTAILLQTSEVRLLRPAPTLPRRLVGGVKSGEQSG
jgi:hypothetical protein